MAVALPVFNQHFFVFNIGLCRFVATALRLAKRVTCYWLRLAVWFCLACCLLVLPVAAETIRLQLKWRHAFQFAGYYAALQQGYYQQAGLHVQLLTAGPGNHVVDVVCSGKADFGVGTSGLLLDYARGKPVQLQANIFQHSAFVLLSRQQRALQDVHDLRGKKIMLEPASDELRAFLQNQGIAPTDYQVLPHSFALTEFINGRVDAMSAYSINEPLVLERAGIPYHVYTPRAAGIDFYGDNLFTCGNRLHPGTIRKFVDASLAGWRYAMAHPTEVIAWMGQNLSMDWDASLLAAEAQALRPLLRLDLIEPGYVSAGRWQHIAEVYQQIGHLQQMPDLNGFLPKQQQQEDRTWLWVSLLVMAGLVLTLLLLTYITRVNRRLQHLLKQQRQQQQWQSCRTQVLQLLLQEHTDVAVAIQKALQILQQYKPAFHPVLLLDRPAQLPLLVDIDLTLDGQRALQQRLAGFTDECATPGLNVLRVPQLGQPSPAFTTCAAGTLRFCAFPLQGDSEQIPGVLLVWQQQPFKPLDHAVLDDIVGLIVLGLERYQARQRLRLSEARHRLLTDHASDVIMTLDPAGQLTYVSPAVERLRGFTAAEVLKEHISDSMTPESARLVQEQIASSRRLVEQGLPYPEFVAELEQWHKDGHTIWVEIKTSAIYDEDGQFIGIVGVARDLTERKKAEAQIRHLAQHDSLTGLPNRLLFQDRLAQALLQTQRQQRQLAVLLLDLNGFKPVNDQYGHASGDELLIAVGARLRQLLRASDTVARLGGDEFVVLLPQLEQPQQAAQVATKIQQALAEPFELTVGMVQIGCSIGAALFPQDGDDGDQLLNTADKRMYQQKQQRQSTR